MTSLAVLLVTSKLCCQTEFELRQPVDPEGGSWYVEHWLLNYAKKSGLSSKTIESKGGIVAALKKGYPQAQVKAILDERFKTLHTAEMWL